MEVYLVYNSAGELQEVHLLDGAAETRAEHFGGTFEGRKVEPLPTYTSDEIQAVVDDLDFARMYFDGGDGSAARIARSLSVASAILTMFPEECLRAQDEYVSR